MVGVRLQVTGRTIATTAAMAPGVDLTGTPEVATTLDKAQKLGLPALSLPYVAAGAQERHLPPRPSFWSHGQLTAVRHPDGSVRGFVEIAQDVSDRRAAELVLEQVLR
ncbi:hypothetical protein KZZ52_05090 [Dactylosporangium sp. AC04546]|uniref:hypothetical protein n=1 Tax=Dactylosporangium sp. AC04546 TaxID=2862460 RepID=UPI001EDF93C0|nr:hypothetical protein [Dactylosporangium sp. AC04546]WVK84791.1 hypothetical protein KZZ52_05090 [Dactylosporangium sp. AC04546]